MALRFELYTRAGCHLCEEMEQELQLLQAKLDFTTEIIDINDNPEHEDYYGDKVPVLAYDNKNICMYIIDESAIRLAIEQHS